MSSPADEEKPAKVPGWKQPWDTWRILMMVGSLLLLAIAFGQIGDVKWLPEWGRIVGFAVGYGLLGYGFYLAMQMRKERMQQRLEEEKKRKKKVSLRDQG